MKWSLHMIIRDAEHKLGRTLESVGKVFDEIVIADTGSTDNTISVAEGFGAIVFQTSWNDNFAEARNEALARTSGDWIMWLDAGDVVPPETVEHLTWLKQQPFITNPDAELNIIWGQLKRIIDSQNNTVMSIGTPRLVKKTANPAWHFPIHEELRVDNAVAVMDDKIVINDPEGSLREASERNLRIMDKCLAEGQDVLRISVLRPRELEMLGRYQEAVEAVDDLYSQPLDNYTFADTYLTSARCYAKMGNDDKERESLLKSLLHDPLRPDALMMLGDMEFRKEKWNRAMPYYRGAIGMTPDPRRNFPIVEPFYTYAPYEKMGYCFLGLDDNKQAFEYFYEAIKLAPDSVARNLKDMVRQVKEYIKKTEVSK